MGGSNEGPRLGVQVIHGYDLSRIRSGDGADKFCVLGDVSSGETVD